MKRGVDYIGVGCGAMIFNASGEVFISKRGPHANNEAGKWDFPGGSVEYGERCEDAVVRELKEEHDITISVIELLEVINHILPSENQHWVSPSFVAKLVSGEAKIMEPDKCTDIKWLPLSEVDHETLTMPSKLNYHTYVKKYGFAAPR